MPELACTHREELLFETTLAHLCRFVLEHYCIKQRVCRRPPICRPRNVNARRIALPLLERAPERECRLAWSVSSCAIALHRACMAAISASVELVGFSRRGSNLTSLKLDRT